MEGSTAAPVRSCSHPPGQLMGNERLFRANPGPDGVKQRTGIRTLAPKSRRRCWAPCPVACSAVPVVALCGYVWTLHRIAAWAQGVYRQTVVDTFLPGGYAEAENYSAVFDDLYAHHGYHDHSMLHISREGQVVEMLMQATSEAVAQGEEPMHTVVIFGCAHGLGAEWIYDRGFLAWGVDVAERAVQLAVATRRRTCGGGFTGPCFVRASLTQLPYVDGHFDAGVSSDVLEHISPADVPQVVAEMTRVVRRLLVLQIAGYADDCSTCEGEDWWAARFVAAGWQVQHASRRPAPWANGFWVNLVLWRAGAAGA